MNIAPFARRFTEAALTLLFPPQCASCGGEVDPREHVCAACREKARRIDAPFCRQCSQPFEGAITSEFTCSNCGDREFHFECAVAPYVSRGVVRDLIHRFKYDRHTYLRHQLASWLSDGLEDERLRARPFDLIVPVPLHSARRRHREFNQAEVLACSLGRRTGKPVVPCLERVRYTTTQTRLDRDERMENLRGAFRVRHTSHVHSAHLLLIDDVFTTGSTVEECARVLVEAGAASVRVLTVARG